jgi:hypothetical protein
MILLSRICSFHSDSMHRQALKSFQEHRHVNVKLVGETSEVVSAYSGRDVMSFVFAVSETSGINFTLAHLIAREYFIV